MKGPNPSDTKIINNKVLPQKMRICDKIYFEQALRDFSIISPFIGSICHQTYVLMVLVEVPIVTLGSNALI